MCKSVFVTAGNRQLLTSKVTMPCPCDVGLSGAGKYRNGPKFPNSPNSPNGDSGRNGAGADDVPAHQALRCQGHAASIRLSVVSPPAALVMLQWRDVRESDDWTDFTKLQSTSYCRKGCTWFVAVVMM